MQYGKPTDPQIPSCFIQCGKKLEHAQARQPEQLEPRDAVDGVEEQPAVPSQGGVTGGG